MDKRKSPPTRNDADEESNLFLKRQKPENTVLNNSFSNVNNASHTWAPQMDMVRPTIHSSSFTQTLIGHTAEIYTCKFSPSGVYIASAGADKSIHLWNTYGDGQNRGIIRGHIGSIYDLHWSKNASILYTASADKTCGVFDSQTGERINCLRGHTSTVNCCSLPNGVNQNILASGSQDGSVKIWDLRDQCAVLTIESSTPITSICFSPENDKLFAGGGNYNINVLDIRRLQPIYSMSGHSSCITSLCLSPSLNELLSCGLDNTLRIWNINPNIPIDARLLCTIQGSPSTFHGSETHLSRAAWSKDETMIGVGDADGYISVWHKNSHHATSRKLVHTARVNQVDFHPIEPLVVSCSSDKSLVLEDVSLR